MVLFHSMNEVTVYIAVTAFLLLLFALRKNPVRVVSAFVQEMFTSRKSLMHFGLVIAILYFNKIELLIERHMNYHADFTGSIYHLEGDFVAVLQHFFKNDLLTVLTSFFYVAVFPTVLIVSIGIYTYERKMKLFYAVCYAMMINYIVAIPFYLFFPVNEVWTFHPQVEFLMTKVFPTFETEYRPLSGVDNCFPSLHTSISISMAVIAWQSGNRFWRRFTAAHALIIIFSIFYLGIHWFTDMCGGLVLGVLAGTVALRVSEARPAGGHALNLVLKSKSFDE